MTLYLLHFSEPLGDTSRPRMHASHYLGFAESPEDAIDRVDKHRKGQGASITKAAVRRGIRLILVGIWPGSQKDERRLKTRGHHADRCCVCRPELVVPGIWSLV